MEKTRKWRWGVNRWIILGLVILSVIGVNLFAPVQPHIQVAPETLSLKPIFSLPVIGDFYLTNTLVAMLLMDVVIVLIALIVRNGSRKNGLVPKGLAGGFEMLLEVLYNLTESTAGKFAKKIFPWFATIMIVVLFANLIKLLPGFETIGVLHHSEHGYEVQALGGNWFTVLNQKAHEGGYVVTPFARALSTDLNFTAALAIISVLMTQVVGIQAQGFRYFSKFLNFRTMFKKPFFGFMDFLVGLLETISEFSKILSFAFRLFGNMFAGMVLLALIGVMVPVFVPSMIMMFELFIGLIQAFVFGMLTMVFMAQATQGHGGEEEHA
ncbi:MAG: F-type H+-transporting ATPase subunit a [Chloroflexi bacterium]|nr:MAG: F-type H+-transporting ATPase subunit a [Chloroflexota bacterium]